MSWPAGLVDATTLLKQCQQLSAEPSGDGITSTSHHRNLVQLELCSFCSELVCSPISSTTLELPLTAEPDTTNEVTLLLFPIMGICRCRTDMC
ncbi:hypothetical protein WDU94_007376 [Cyamophila willieti]